MWHTVFSRERRKIRKWVRELLETGIPACAGALETFGEAAVPDALDALRDPRARPSPENADPKPLQGLCRVLYPFAPGQATPILASYLPRLRGDALRIATGLLLKIGTPEAIDAVAQQLTADEAEQRAPIELALLVEARHGLRLGPSEANVLFELLAPRLSLREGQAFRGLLQTLLTLNVPRVSSRLREQGYLDPGHRHFAEVLDTFDWTKVTPPLHVLESLAPVLREREERTRASTGSAGSPRTYGTLLRLLARASPDAARPLVDAAMVSGDAVWVAGAVRAMSIIARVEDATEVVGIRMRQANPGGGYTDRPELLSGPQRTYWIAFSVDMAVRNNGFEAYFSGSGRSHAREAPAALEAVGAPRSAQVMRDALTALGEERLGAAEQHEVISYDDTVREAFVSLESRYYGSGEDVLQQLTLFAVRHREHFTAER